MTDGVPAVSIECLKNSITFFPTGSPRAIDCQPFDVINVVYYTPVAAEFDNSNIMVKFVGNIPL